MPTSVRETIVLERMQHLFAVIQWSPRATWCMRQRAQEFRSIEAGARFHLINPLRLTYFRTQ